MFVPLPPTDGPPAGRAGCLLMLATVLLLLGGGIVAVFFVNPAGKGDMWVMPVVGGGFALVGALMLFAGVRGARGLKIPEPQLLVERDVRLAPGATVRIRLRQPGPMMIDSLRLSVCCERVYERQVKPDSSATVQDRELICEQVLAEVKDQRVPAGESMERVAALTLPADARPTGAVRPDGEIRWQVEVRAEAGFMRATYRAFEIQVQPVGGAAAMALPAASSSVASDLSLSSWACCRSCRHRRHAARLSG